MPANTPRGYSYPLYTDPADPQAAIQDLAQDVDTDVQSLVNQRTEALNRPSARASATSNQNIAAGGGFTFVTWVTEEYDNDAMINLGVNNDRITINESGIYLVHAEINFASNGNATVGSRVMRLEPNLSAITGWDSRRGAQNMDTEMSVTDLIRVGTVPDFVRVSVHQTSGAALNISARSFSATKVSDL